MEIHHKVKNNSYSINDAKEKFLTNLFPNCSTKVNEMSFILPDFVVVVAFELARLVRITFASVIATYVHSKKLVN